jgi:3-deoxy-D-manno-octulosonic-acid transferase
LILAIYNLLLPFGLLVALPGFWLKMRRRGGYRRDFWQRIGIYRPEVRARLARMDKPVWLHAVSVGEVLVARKLIDELLRRKPDLDVVLSTTTSTGHAVARRTAPDRLLVLYNPVDLKFCVRRALDAIRPRLLVLVEAEVWPNLVAESRRWGIGVALANARLSPRSERRYRRALPFVAPVFGLVERAFVPEPGDRNRWARLGIAPDAITVTGSVKHDYESQPPDPRRGEFENVLGELWGRPLPPMILAASTHAGEEALIGKACLELRRTFPSLKFLVAPRHFERAAAVASELERLGLKVGRRSLAPTGEIDTFVIDTTGELAAWQGLADVVIIGKSFLSAGGQNPVEAIIAGRPVIFGPHMENFSTLAESLRREGGAIQVSGIDELVPAIARLLNSPDEARRHSENGRRALAPHQGAARRTAAGLLEEPPADGARVE